MTGAVSHAPYSDTPVPYPDQHRGMLLPATRVPGIAGNGPRQWETRAFMEAKGKKQVQEIENLAVRGGSPPAATSHKEESAV